MCIILSYGYYSYPPDNLELWHINTIRVRKGTFSDQKVDTTRPGSMDGWKFVH